MKTILFILPLTGAALLASAAEPVKPETPSATTTMSVTKNSSNAPTGGLDAVDKAYDAKLGERLARSGAVTTKAERSATKGFMQSFNPFAPTKPAPTTPWLSRVAWSTAAESAAGSSTPVEARHEARCGVVVCTR